MARWDNEVWLLGAEYSRLSFIQMVLGLHVYKLAYAAPPPFILRTGDVKEVEKLQENGFWTDKVPCWVIRKCISQARQQCGAYQDQSRPCWEHQDTLCKELFGLDTCFVCKVFKRYGPQ